MNRGFATRWMTWQALGHYVVNGRGTPVLMRWMTWGAPVHYVADHAVSTGTLDDV